MCPKCVMMIFQLCLILLMRKAESSECLHKPGFGLSKPAYNKFRIKTQPFGPVDLDSCKTNCDEMVLGFLDI